MAPKSIYESRAMFGTIAPGLEAVLAEELATIEASDIQVVPGGVEFTGDLETMYRANLCLRTAGRVLLRLDRFFAVHLAKLHKRACHFHWEDWLRGDRPIFVRATCHKSRIYHSVAAAERVAMGIAERLGLSELPDFGAGAPPESVPWPTVLVRIDHDHCTISLDGSGEHLHRRGYRTESVEAPLRENLAAAALLLSGWAGKEPIADPMCGSGTIPIEAAMIAAHIPPGLSREFAFMHWAAYDSVLWERLQGRARQRIRKPQQRIWASDLDAEAVWMARRNAERAALSECIDFSRMDAAEFTPDAPRGLLICNPPYGKRVGQRKHLRIMYRAIGDSLRRYPSHWRLSLITNDPHFAAACGLPFTQVSAPFPNGGVRVKVYATPPGVDTCKLSPFESEHNEA